MSRMFLTYFFNTKICISLRVTYFYQFCALIILCNNSYYLMKRQTPQKGKTEVYVEPLEISNPFQFDDHRQENPS